MHPQQREALLRRRLDERVADEVMGFFVIKEGLSPNVDGCLSDLSNEYPSNEHPCPEGQRGYPETILPGMVMTTSVWKKFFLANPGMKPSQLEAYLLKSYSVLPRYAFDVIKRMQNLGFDYTLASEGKPITATFRRGDQNGTGVSESMAKSVCLAALEAIQGYWDE